VSRLIFLIFLVSIFLSNSSQLANHVENEQTKQRSVCHLYPISSTGMNNSEYSIHHLASSCVSSLMEVAPPSPCKISASAPIGLYRTEHEGFHCPGIYGFVQRTICFEQIEYQPRHLDNTQINIKTQGRMILVYNEGINEVLSANN